MIVSSQPSAVISPPTGHDYDSKHDEDDDTLPWLHFAGAKMATKKSKLDKNTTQNF